MQKWIVQQCVFHHPVGRQWLYTAILEETGYRDSVQLIGRLHSIWPVLLQRKWRSRWSIRVSLGLWLNHFSISVHFRKHYFIELKDRFLKSVTARLTVAQVADGVLAGAECSFDYFMYLLGSCTIASIALLNTQTVDIAAAMCIEPLMVSPRTMLL